MNNNEINLKNLRDAADRFYSSYKDSYGFHLLAYLNAKGLVRKAYDVTEEDTCVVDTLDVETLETMSAADAQRWREEGHASESLCFERPDGEMGRAADIILEDIHESRMVNGIGHEVLFDVQMLLSKVDFSSATDEITKFLIDCVSRIQGRRHGVHRKMGPFVLPVEMRKLIGSIIEYDGGLMFSPTAGVGTFDWMNTIPEDLFHGYVTNKYMWATGMCLTQIAGYIPAGYTNKSYRGEWPLIRPSFIVATPEPYFNLPVPDDPGSYVSVEKHILQCAFDQITKDGRIVMSMRSEMLNAFTGGPRKEWNEYDEYVDYCLKDRAEDMLCFLDTVILLPKGLIWTPDTRQVVMVFDKRKPQGSPIRMVDASGFFTKTSSLSILKVDELLEAIENETPGVVCHVSLETIGENVNDLNPAMYVSESIRLNIPKGSRRLEEFLVPYDGIEPHGESMVIKVDSRTLDGRTYPQSLVKGTPARILERECLVLNRQGNIRPIHFVPREGMTIGYDNHSMAFVLRDSVDFDYLLVELNKDYVRQQIGAKMKGAVIPMLSAKDILSLRIVVPDTLEEQRESVQGSAADLAREYTERYVKELEEQHIAKMEEFKKEMHLRKHALNQRLNQLVPGIRRLITAMEQHDGVLDSEMIVGSMSGDTVQQRLQKIQEYSNRIQEMVKSLTDEGSDFDDTEDMMWVEGFAQEYCKERIHDGYEFDLDLDRYKEDFIFKLDDGDFIKYSKGDLKEKGTIRMSRKGLTQILDNILTNVEKYGFTDPGRYDYVVRFTTERKEKNGKAFLILKVSNNGSPLPKGMTSEKVLQWGESSGGSGLGGWQIASIARKFEGYAKVNSYPEDRDGFFVEYEMGFPVSNSLGNLLATNK